MMTNQDLCGPSNALNGFSQHVDQDRSGQLGRPAGESQPGQVFRSPAANENAEFGQFAAANAPFPAGPAFATNRSSYLPNTSIRMTRPLPIRGPQTLAPTEVPQGQASMATPPARSPTVASEGSNNVSPQNPHVHSASGAQGQAAPLPVVYPGCYPVFHFHPMAPHGPPMYAGAAPMWWTPMHPDPVTSAQHLAAFAQEMNRAQQNNEQVVPEHLQNVRKNLTAAQILPSSEMVEALEEDFDTHLNEWLKNHGSNVDIGVSSGPASNPAQNASIASNVKEVDTQSHEELDEEEDDQVEQDLELAKNAREIAVFMQTVDSSKFERSEFLTMMKQMASLEKVVRDGDLVDNPELTPSTPPTKIASSASQPS